VRGVLPVLACALAAAAFQIWTADPDVFWHLKAGEWIARNRAVPRADVWSWSASGQPWTAHQWLWEVLMHLLHGAFGLPGLWLLVFASASACGLFIRAGLLARGAGSGSAGAAGCAAPFLLACWLKPWPQAGTYALFSAYLWLSLRGRWGRAEAAGAFALAALWANIHANACMLPLLLLAEFAGLRLLEGRAERGLLAASGAALLGTLANPHGLGLWAYAVGEGLLSPEYRRHIAEWMPFFFAPSDMVVSFFACAAVLLWAAARGKAGTVGFARAAGFWTLALLSRIHMPWAVLSTAALFGELRPSFREGFPARMALLALAGAAAFLAARGVPADLDAAAKACRFPVAAAGFVLERGYQRPFNDYGFGGYLIWKGVPVYIDGRADLYKRGGLFKRYVGLADSNEKLSDYIESIGADAALLVARSWADRALMESPRWRCVWRDGAAAVYEPARVLRPAE
jgi:hypothetical protein